MESLLILASVGFLSDEENSALKEAIPWKEATQKILGASNDSEQDLTWAISSKASFKDNEEKEQLLAGLKWIGIVSSSAHLHILFPSLHNVPTRTAWAQAHKFPFWLCTGTLSCYPIHSC